MNTTVESLPLRPHRALSQTTSGRSNMKTTTRRKSALFRQFHQRTAALLQLPAGPHTTTRNRSVGILEDALSYEGDTTQPGQTGVMSSPPQETSQTSDPFSSSEVEEIELPFPAYYRARGAKYYVERPDGRWLSPISSQLKRRLKSAGLASRDEQETAITKIEDKFDVSYAAPLAGKRSGFYEENGIRFLVTESPKLIDPVSGDWPNLRKVILGLLVDSEPDHGEALRHTFLGWLKSGVEALRGGRHQNATGTMLGKVARWNPHRISDKRTAKKRA